MANTEKNLERAKDKLDMVNQWIANCDTKSSFLLAFYGVLLALVFTSEVRSEISKTFALKSTFNNIGWTEKLNFISVICIVAFIGCSILCLYFIYNTLRARIDDRIYRQPELNADSKIFFNTISKKTFKVFKDDSNAEICDDYLNDLNSQVFINSKIATEKFKAYNWSLLFGFSGVILIGIYLLVI
ncbi:MAG: hypothetical protein ACERIH_07085 [Labilibaculum antarcticum]